MRSRSTLAGHVPTSWAKPFRSTIVTLAVVAAIADGFVWLTAPQGMLDTEFVYGPQQVAAVLIALGEGGRGAYRLSALVDLGFIVMYTALLVNWIRFFRNRKIGERWARPALGLLPGVFDLIETASILALLHMFPDSSSPLVYAAVFATPLKWLSLLGVSGMIVAEKWRGGENATGDEALLGREVHDVQLHRDVLELMDRPGGIVGGHRHLGAEVGPAVDGVVPQLRGSIDGSLRDVPVAALVAT